MIGHPPLFHWQELLVWLRYHYYGLHVVGQSTHV